MDDRVHVRRIHSLRQPAGDYRFDVEVELHQQTLHVLVDAQELLDFDRFQAAALAQTGWLVMAPCGPGAEGPDHYRRHRRVWSTELQSAVWVREPQPARGPASAPPAPAAGSAAMASAVPGSISPPHAGVPKPKSPELRGQSLYRLG